MLNDFIREQIQEQQDQQRERRLDQRHVDTLCCSIMTLVTIAMGGLFAFIRTSLADWHIDAISDLGPSDVPTIGTLVALMLYVTGIWRGMRVLKNHSVVGKNQTFRRFQSHCIFIVLVIALTISAGIVVQIQADQTLSDSGGIQGGPPVAIQ